MSDIVMTAAEVGIADPGEAVTKDFDGDSTTTVGKWVYVVAATGKVALADANVATPVYQCIGVVTSKRGNTVTVCKRGHVYGFTLAGDYGTPVFLSDTVGAIADAASGTKTVPVGRVMPIPDGSTRTKCLYVDIPWAAHIA